ncbi:bifunctional adenosylcobinamide kinase/adenosylcobinamide-phosphate guanylyltransferase [Yoonia sp. GPGPB17]|uniref:bifunctional adenosylcobinamide kinase/adenosylcobinamide-phosphate guanylyltransferase n=1 Tax=Yoonia sp. GPGPB17 TaxID=3026147 RepID=UPI0030BE8428
MVLPKLTLILGGAASGKSSFAESLVLKGGDGDPIYIATAQVFDNEMAEKVAKHRAMRGTGWRTIEEPLYLADALAKVDANQPVLIDCATLWLTNVILGEHGTEAQSVALMAALERCKGPVVIVSNEVGQGIVPENKLSRTFRNAQGRLNQEIATKSDLVVAVMAGLPLALKGQLP